MCREQEGVITFDYPASLFESKFQGCFTDASNLVEFYMNEHCMKDWQIEYYNTLSKKIDFKGKRVLEIGGSNTPRELTLQLFGAEKWVCVDKPWQHHLDRWEKHYSEITSFHKDEISLPDAF